MKNDHYLFHWSFLSNLTPLLLFLNIWRLLVVWSCRIGVHLLSSPVSVCSHCKRVRCCLCLLLLAFLLWLGTLYDWSPWHKSSCLFDFFCRNFLIIKLLELWKCLYYSHPISWYLSHRVLPKPQRSEVWQILEVPELIETLDVVSPDVQFSQVCATSNVFESWDTVDRKW